MPLLKRDLVWRIQNTDNQVVEVADVKGLKIFVVAREVLRQGGGGEKGDEFPVFGKLEMWGEATEGKVGGLDKGK